MLYQNARIKNDDLLIVRLTGQTAERTPTDLDNLI